MTQQETIKRVVQFNAPDGIYQLPIEVVAKNRADYYAEKDGFTKDSEDYADEFELVCTDNFEAIDWLLNNTNFADIEKDAVKISDEKRLTEKFWSCSDDFEIISL